MKIFNLGVVFLGASLIACAPALAQLSSAGTVSGQVTDQQGAHFEAGLRLAPDVPPLLAGLAIAKQELHQVEESAAILARLLGAIGLLRSCRAIASGCCFAR